MTLEKDLKLLADLKASRDDIELRIKEVEEKIKKELNKWGIPFEKEVEKYVPYYPYWTNPPLYTPTVWNGTAVNPNTGGNITFRTFSNN